MRNLIDIFKFNNNNKEKSISYAFEGEIKRRKNEFKEALSYFNKAIRLDDSNADFYMLRALVKLELSDFQGSLKDINKAIVNNKSYNWYHIHKYTIQKRMGLKEQAKKDLLLIEENEDNNLDSLFNYLAELELKDNNKREAIYFLEKALSKNSKNEKLIIKKINLQCSMGDYEKAYLDAQNLIELNTLQPEYYHIKSTVCFEQKNFDEALILSNRTIELCQTNHGYYAHRARINKELKNYNNGLKDINVALSIDNSNLFYKELREQFLSVLCLIDGNNSEENM